MTNVRSHQAEEAAYEGRAKDCLTLEEQLQEGLEVQFPASDPASVVSPPLPAEPRSSSAPMKFYGGKLRKEPRVGCPVSNSRTRSSLLRR